MVLPNLNLNLAAQGGSLSNNTGGPTITYPPPPPGFVNPSNPGLQAGTLKVSNSGLIIVAAVAAAALVAGVILLRR